MINKISKTVLFIVVIVIIVWGFSDSYSSLNIDNIVHVVAIGIDKSDNSDSNIKVSFQFINTSSGSGSEGSSGGDTSSVITSISSDTVNKAINLMNSYIGKELNFSHCKVIVFSEDFAKEGISTEICTFINNEEIRPSTNIVISTSDANSYLKNANPNIEKIITNYYDTFELTSNFTGYSDDSTLGDFYNKLFHPFQGNTAILGRTFEKVSNSSASQVGSENNNSNSSSNEESQNSTGSSSKESSNSSNTNPSQGTNQEQDSSNSQQNSSSGQNSGGNNSQEDSSGASLEISGERGTQNVGIAVFKDDKYVGQLTELDSICHLLITNNVDSFLISVPIENFPDNVLDLSVSRSKNSKITVDTSSQNPDISISVYCEAKVLTIDKGFNYEDSDFLEKISRKAEEVLKGYIVSYVHKTSKEFNSDIASFGNYSLAKFLTTDDWQKYDWASKYKNATFNVNVNINVISSILFSGNNN